MAVGLILVLFQSDGTAGVLSLLAVVPLAAALGPTSNRILNQHLRVLVSLGRGAGDGGTHRAPTGPREPTAQLAGAW